MNPPQTQRSELAAGSIRTEQHLLRVRDRQGTLRETLGALLPSGTPLVWEVGCGHGHFLTAYAAANPAQLCLGIDIVRERIERATRKGNRARLPGLHFVLAEAYEFIAALPSEVKFSAVYVLFPDPWPKRRHHKNRLMQAPFLNAIAGRAGEETRIYFRTDFEPYFLEVKNAVQTHSAWELVEEPWHFETETVFQARAAHYFSLVARPRR